MIQADSFLAAAVHAGFDFYSRLFGWTKVNDMDMGPMGVYRIFDEGEHKQMGDGGMMIKAPHIPAACWNFYFNVDSINAAVERVKAGGGQLLSGPTEVPGGSWIAQCLDPQGAMFALAGHRGFGYFPRIDMSLLAGRSK